MLDYLNKTEFLSSWNFSSSDELLVNIKIKDSTIFHFLKWTITLEKKTIFRTTVLDSKKDLVDIIEITHPTILYDSINLNRQLLIKDSLVKKNNLSIKQIQLLSNRIDSFLKANPVCTSSMPYDLLKNNKWLDLDTFDNWVDLLSKGRIEIWKAFNPPTW
ncbi:MAG: hypothetical protein U0T79_06200 [Ferruginibacter sp.]